jgi:hypothetical protein
MTNWQDFNSEDLKSIKYKIKSKFERALMWTLAFTIPLMFVAPYFPSKRDHGRLIDRMSYWDAVVYFTLMWLGLVFIVALYNIYRSNRK